MSSDTQSQIINQEFPHLEPSSAIDCKGDGAGSVPPVGHLYLSSNNSDKPTLEESKLSPYHKKQAYIVSQNAKRFISRIGVNKVGFLTLTFKENLTDHHEASRRFNNLNRRFISEHFGDWALVKEEQKRGAWHYHILIDCLGDIRTGFDFDNYSLAMKIRKSAFQNGIKYKDYKKTLIPIERAYINSASGRLQRIWHLMNKTMKNYGFGRCEILPIASNIDGMAQYVGKYVSSHVENRKESSKGIRLSSYSKGFIRSCTSFQWNNEKSKQWRLNVSILAKTIGCTNQDELHGKLGAKWAYVFKDLIFDIAEYTRETILEFVKNNSPAPKFREKYGGHLQVCGETGFLTDQLTGEVLF